MKYIHAYRLYFLTESKKGFVIYFYLWKMNIKIVYLLIFF